MRDNERDLAEDAGAYGQAHSGPRMHGARLREALKAAGNRDKVGQARSKKRLESLKSLLTLRLKKES